jgi:hypothetical protein
MFGPKLQRYAVHESDSGVVEAAPIFDAVLLATYLHVHTIRGNGPRQAVDGK